MLLNKSAIIHIVERLMFPIDQYSILMGAALVLHGVKKFANDIDLGCSPELFESFRKTGYEISVNRAGYQKIVIDEYISIYKGWMPTKTVLIEGVPVSDLESIVSDKKRFNRPKDVNDIALIKAFLANKRGVI